MKETTAFELTAEYAGTVEVLGDDGKATGEERPRYAGGVISIPPDGRNFDLAEELEGGGGQIVVDTANVQLVDALRGRPELKEVSAPEGAEAITAYTAMTGRQLAAEIKRRGLKPEGRTNEHLIAALEAADRAVASGENPSPTEA